MRGSRVSDIGRAVSLLVNVLVEYVSAYEEEWEPGEVIAVLEGVRLEMYARYLKGAGFVQYPRPSDFPTPQEEQDAKEAQADDRDADDEDAE